MNNENTILATVGDREITKNDIEMLLKTINPQTAQQFQSKEGKKQLLNELITQELLYLDAIDNGLDKDEDFLLEVEKAKVTMVKQHAVNKLLSTVTVTDDEISKFYEDNKDIYQSQKSVNASHILVDSLEEANSISSEIKEGLDFGEAAKKYSSCPSKNKGGELGFFLKGAMVPEFEEVAFSLEKDAISEPVKTQFGYHIVKVTDVKESKPQTFDEVKGKIKAQLVTRKQQEIYIKKSSELKSNYKVEINEE